MSPDSSGSADRVSLHRSKIAERLLLPAAFITTAGNAFQITAAAILVFRAGSTTLSVGWLFIAVSIPQVALSLLFGRLVDKVDRRTLCVLSDLVSAVTAFALPLWLWLHQSVSLGSYLANFLLACSATLFMPASNALVKERIRDDRLGKYNSRYEMATNAGMLLASSLAGFLVVVFGPTPLFVFNSITFVASAALTYFVGRKPAKAPAPAAEETPEQASTEQAGTGLDQRAEHAGPVARRVPIRRLGLLYTSGNINLMVANVILTALILQTFHQGAWLVGVTDALAGVGFILGAASYGWISARFSGLRMALICSLICCVTIVLEPVHYVVLMIVIPFAGFFFANFRIAARTLLMKASPEDRVGRIFGGAQAFGLGLGIAATLGLSVLADRTSVPVAFWSLAALIGAIAIGSYLSLAGALAPAPPAATPQPTTPQPAAPEPTLAVATVEAE
jgi:MFS family permease